LNSSTKRRKKQENRSHTFVDRLIQKGREKNFKENKLLLQKERCGESGGEQVGFLLIAERSCFPTCGKRRGVQFEFLLIVERILFQMGKT
jgi:hypothetical protein